MWKRVSIGLMVAIMGVVAPVASAQEGAEGASAGCTRYIYNVLAEKPVYDSWSTSSRVVWHVYATDRIESWSSGSTFVRVDSLRQGGVWTPAFNDDYVTKTNLDYVTCY